MERFLLLLFFVFKGLCLYAIDSGNILFYPSGAKEITICYNTVPQETLCHPCGGCDGPIGTTINLQD